MKPEDARNLNGDSSPVEVSDEIKTMRARIFAHTAKGREERARNTKSFHAASSASTMVRGARALVELLPAAGVLSLTWDEATQRLAIDPRDAERLRDFQRELGEAQILCGFGSHRIVFARDVR